MNGLGTGLRSEHPPRLESLGIPDSFKFVDDTISMFSPSGGKLK